MARQEINIGTSANDGTGDPLRTAFDKINDNQSEVYTNLGGDSLSNIGHTGNTIQSLNTNGNIVLSPNGTGTIEFPAISFNDNNIAGSRSNDNLNISASGSGVVNVSSALTTIGQTITGDVSVTGNSTVSGNISAGTIGVGDLNITSDGTITSDTNGDIAISPSGTGSLIASGLRIAGTEISADDSGAVTIRDNLNVTGFLTVTQIDTNTLTSADSTAINITESLNVSGSLTASDINGTVRTDKLQSETSNADIQVDTQGTGLVDFRTETQQTVGAVGAASKLPLDSANEVRPVGYLKIKVGGTEYVVPYFNAS